MPCADHTLNIVVNDAANGEIFGFMIWYKRYITTFLRSHIDGIYKKKHVKSLTLKQGRTFISMLK